jgi:NADH-quinone oxidoreductase subunit J
VELVIQIIFFVVAGLIIGSAMMVVTVRNIIHAALWLITSFMGVAILYLMMEAEFLAIVQVLLYVGAVSVLVLFAIMVTRQVTNPQGQQLYQRWWIGALVAGLLFAVILVPTLANEQWNTAPAPAAGATVAPDISGVEQIGAAFMQEYLLPFELAAMLLFVALVGAIVVAYEERARRRRILTLAEEWELRKQQASSEGSEAQAADVAADAKAES